MLLLLPGAQVIESGSGLLLSPAPFSPGNWTRLALSVHPSNRSGFALAYDGKDGYVLGFGGSKVHGRVLNETWTFSGGNWTQLFPKVSPPGSNVALLAYDASSGQVIYFGGEIWYGSSRGGVSLNETWAFSRGSWSMLHSVHSPPASRYGFMDYDASTGKIVLYIGNIAANGTLVGFETWTFQGGNWTQLTTAGMPSTYPSGLAYDPVYKTVVLVGAVSHANLTIGTWLLRHGSWVLSPTTSAPPGSSVLMGAQKLTYDANSSFLVLVCAGNYAERTWKFANGHWSPLRPLHPPRTRYNFGMAFDPPDGYVVQFGGESFLYGGAIVDSDQTWTYR